MSTSRPRLVRFAAAAALPVAATLGAACGGTVVEPEPIPTDYTDWDRVDTTGALPGHGDSYRIIYANPTARSYAGAGPYPVGSVVVKEIHALTSDGGPGALSYLGVMRKLDQAPDGGELDRGWLFTYLADSIESDEEYRGSCWATCHRAAPYDGLFLDYGIH